MMQVRNQPKLRRVKPVHDNPCMKEEIYTVIWVYILPISQQPLTFRLWFLAHMYISSICFLQNQYGFLFRLEICFRTTRELEYFFFCSAKREFFFQNSTLGYMTKTLNQIIFFFLHQNQNIFFSNIGNQNIFLEKKHNPPLSS